MTTLPHSAPAGMIAYWGTVVVWAVGERVLSFRDLRSGAWRSGQDRSSVLWVVLGIVGGFAAAIVLASRQALSLPDPPVWLLLGLVLAWAGLLLRLWAVVTLGRSFTTTVQVRPGQQVVATGPYRLVRHPSYLGLLVLFLGLGLGLGDLAGAVVLVVLPALALVRRIQVEEAALRAGLGDRYDDYAAGRARLLPRVW